MTPPAAASVGAARSHVDTRRPRVQARSSRTACAVWLASQRALRHSSTASAGFALACPVLLGQRPGAGRIAATSSAASVRLHADAVSPRRRAASSRAVARQHRQRPAHRPGDAARSRGAVAARRPRPGRLTPPPAPRQRGRGRAASRPAPPAHRDHRPVWPPGASSRSASVSSPSRTASSARTSASQRSSGAWRASASRRRSARRGSRSPRRLSISTAQTSAARVPHRRPPARAPAGRGRRAPPGQPTLHLQHRDLRQPGLGPQRRRATRRPPAPAGRAAQARTHARACRIVARSSRTGVVALRPPRRQRGLARRRTRADRPRGGARSIAPRATDSASGRREDRAAARRGHGARPDGPGRQPFDHLLVGGRRERRRLQRPGQGQQQISARRGARRREAVCGGVEAMASAQPWRRFSAARPARRSGGRRHDHRQIDRLGGVVGLGRQRRGEAAVGPAETGALAGTSVMTVAGMGRRRRRRRPPAAGQAVPRPEGAVAGGARQARGHGDAR